MTNAEIIGRGERYLARTYNRAPIVITEARGHLVRDADGTVYVDLTAGLGVHNFGHCHPAVVSAVRAQVDRLCHVSNLFFTEPQADLAARLCQLSGAARVFFANSGTEANEGAIKLARAWASAEDPQRIEIIAMQEGFHGRTFGSLAATGLPRPRTRVGPLLPGFVHVPFNDLDAVRRACSERTCAVMLEPVLGEGGVVAATSTFFRGLRRVCDEHRLLLIVDEVQTGFWRTGTLLAHMQFEIAADVVTVGKALAGGLPIGAILISRPVADVWHPGDHATTFGGNPLVCAAALATLDVAAASGAAAQGRELAREFHHALDALARRRPVVAAVRGMGLMIGVVLHRPAEPIIAACRRRGFLVTGTAQPNVIRLLPPLTMPTAVVAQFVDALEAALDEAAAPLATWQ